MDLKKKRRVGRDLVFTIIRFQNLITMSSKGSKKQLQSESYSHPLVRSIQESVTEDHSKVIPTYQPFQPSHQHRTSSKLLRWSTLTPSNHSTLTVFFTPLHPIAQEIPVLQRPLDCPHCGCMINPLVTIENYSVLTCNLCRAASPIPTYDNQQYKDSYAWRYCTNDGANKEEERRKVCLIVEASQYNFEKGVHRAITTCINALANIDIDIGFIFFDQKYLYFLDQLTQQITKITLSEGQEWEGLPVQDEGFFQPISEFSDETASTIENIMYQAFYMKESGLPKVTKLLKQHLTHYELKFFITTLNHLADQPKTSQMTQSSNHFLSKIFKEKQNYPQPISVKKEYAKKGAGKQGNMLQLGENMQFFVITQNTTFQESIDLLGYHLARAYGISERSLQETLYYDLFQNIEIKHHSNVQVTIRTSNCLQLLISDSSAYSLHGKVKAQTSQTAAIYKTYKMHISQCSQTTTVPLKFKINASPCETPFFQLTYRHPNHQAFTVLNWNALKVHSETEMGLEWLDDEALFNDHFRIAAGGGIQGLKAGLQQECGELIRLFRSNYSYDCINFPKTMKHYFLYVFCLLEKIRKGVLTHYLLYRLLHCGLQTFSKQLYYRAYRLEGTEIRNIKANSTIFDKYNVIFLDNGQQLFMVFNDAPVSELKELFGYFDTIEGLAASNYQLPELPSNLSYRNAVSAIRKSNVDSFLRLKIVDKQSSYFDCFIAPGLYDKTEHFSFLRKTWKGA